MKAIAAMTDMPKSARRVYGLHRIRYARWQAEQDKIFAGTHQRILDLEPFGGRSQLNDHVWRIPRAERPRCGARCRTGQPCQMRAVEGKKRCRLHGGASTGPKSEAGRQAIAESNRRRARSAILRKDQ
jgi:hypothetical protein